MRHSQMGLALIAAISLGTGCSDSSGSTGGSGGSAGAGGTAGTGGTAGSGGAAGTGGTAGAGGLGGAGGHGGSGRPCNSSGTVEFSFSGAGDDPDCIAPGVCIARGNAKGLFNSVTEVGADNPVSPEGTLWAESTCAEATVPDDFGPASPVTGGGNLLDLCVWLTNENFFYDLAISEWGSQENSNFTYTRTAVDADECGVDTATCGEQCGCPPGWVNQDGDGICVLPDPCDANPCGAGALCRRTGAASHRCECNTVDFTKPPGMTATVDSVSAGVSLARGDQRVLYNSLVESAPTMNCDTFSGPTLTQWAGLPCDEAEVGDFGTFCDLRVDGMLPRAIVGVHSCLNTTDDNAFWDIQFTGWCSEDSGGCFSYIRWMAVDDGVACD